MAPHVVTGTVYDGLVLGMVLAAVLSGVLIAPVAVPEILMRQVNITVEIMRCCHHGGGGRGGQWLECSGVTRVAPLV